MKLPATTPHFFSPTASMGRSSLQRGLSLIELMISIAIGLMILAALTTLFINQSKTRSELDKSNRMIDNGRYAMELLSNDLSLAGFYGELNPNGLPLPAALPNPCTLVPANMEAALPLAIQGYDAADAASTAAAPCGLNPDLGSDVLVIRRASTATPIVAGVALNGRHYLQVSGCQSDATNHIIGNSAASFTLRRADCKGLADLRNFMVRVYFVSPDNEPGDGIPTLTRFELDPTNQDFVVTPLVEGIEYLQIDYGLDTNNDGAPDQYIAAPALANWPNIVAAKVYILARNTESTRGHIDTKTYNLGIAGAFGPFNDEFKRHAYTEFVTLVNPAGRRQ